MKLFITLIIIISIGSDLKSQSQQDTVYLCLRYKNINRNGPGLTGTDTDFERIFFITDSIKRVFLGQPNNYFQNYNFRYIRLLLPKEQFCFCCYPNYKETGGKKRKKEQNCLIQVLL